MEYSSSCDVCPLAFLLQSGSRLLVVGVPYRVGRSSGCHSCNVSGGVLHNQALSRTHKTTGVHAVRPGKGGGGGGQGGGGGGGGGGRGGGGG